MRKRNCDKLFDNIMWYLIYLLPLIFALLIYNNPDFFNIILEQSGFTPTNLGGVLSDLFLDLGFAVDVGSFASIFYDVLELFGLNGAEFWLAQYLSYFVVVFCGHLMVDFILFIPRLAHKWLNHAYQGD